MPDCYMISFHFLPLNCYCILLLDIHTIRFLMNLFSQVRECVININLIISSSMLSFFSRILRMFQKSVNKIIYFSYHILCIYDRMFNFLIPEFLNTLEALPILASFNIRARSENYEPSQTDY